MKSESELLRAVVGNLPQRQFQVLVLLLDGGSEKSVARELNLSVNTVHNHVKELHVRFGVHTRAELISAVYRLIIAELRHIAESENRA